MSFLVFLLEGKDIRFFTVGNHLLHKESYSYDYSNYQTCHFSYLFEDSSCDDDLMSEEDVFVRMGNKKELRPIDEQFDKLCEEYSGTDDEGTNEVVFLKLI